MVKYKRKQLEDTEIFYIKAGENKIKVGISQIEALVRKVIYNRKFFNELRRNLGINMIVPRADTPRTRKLRH